VGFGEKPGPEMHLGCIRSRENGKQTCAKRRAPLYIKLLKKMAIHFVGARALDALLPTPL